MEQNPLIESLQLIDSMIKQARNRFSENGHLYLVWGWTIFVITLMQFLLSYFQVLSMAKLQFLWMLCFIPWLYMMIYLGRKQKKAAVRTYTEEIMGHIWLVFAVLMFLSGFVLGATHSFFAIYPVTLVLYGMPTVLSGSILRFRPLIYGGITCWLLAIVCVHIPIQFQILFITAAVLSAWIVPGYLLRLKFQNTNS